MSLSFGLNVKPKSSAPSKVPPAKKASIFDSDDSETEDAPTNSAKDAESITTLDFSSSRPSNDASKPASRPKPSAPKGPLSLSSRAPKEDFADLTSARESARHQTTATELDPSIYDYDTFHASKSAVESAQKAAAKQDAIERKPKYINNLLTAAAQRKQDQAVAKEKALQREREAEGDEFAGSETFVTEAYKKQREENRRIEEEEERRRKEEEKGRKDGLGGLGRFYKGVLGEQEKVFEEKRVAAEKAIREGVKEVETEKGEEKDEVEEARRRGVEVVVNEEGQVTDKRQLLSAGLNVGGGGKGGKAGAEHLKTKERPKENAFKGFNKGGQKDSRERQTRMMEEQLAASAKRKADEEAEERRKMEHAAKSKKTEGDVMSAKERYLARKKEREEAAKNGA
ncbi:L-type lectin-like domain-containing protein [Elsinoe australis]|uniref:L-type lectin-like domain-containing protein n=1 Tax=Elsinoe australis TaxID=40998 RepID=A0A2P7ZY64_9PEZI|nr:L-type lectin-like domain-containing protein [Elsinoe australis]